jgi:hypothetical protein
LKNTHENYGSPCAFHSKDISRSNWADDKRVDGQNDRTKTLCSPIFNLRGIKSQYKVHGFS